MLGTFVKTPELTLSLAEKKALTDCFFRNYSNAYHYVAENGNPTGLTIINKISEPCEEVSKLVGKIPSEYFWDFAFLGNYGDISLHVDDTRQAVISWPLIYEGTPTTFTCDEFPHHDVITELEYHDNIPAIWNTKKWHLVKPSNGFRLFFQIELHQRHDYAFYENLYRSGELLRPKDVVTYSANW